MSRLTDGQRSALNYARHLAEYGVPVFLAKPDEHASTGYQLPIGWQRTTPDPAVLDRWRPGMAVCAVMGHGVDAIDVDPRNGDGYADLVAEGLVPRSYGRQSTPSGGTHDLVASLGVGKCTVAPGVDLQAGVNGEGHGFVFLAPTERVSKVTGELGTYTWTTPPDLGPLLLLDDSGSALAARLSARAARAPRGEPVGSGAPPTRQELEKAENTLAKAAREMTEAPEGERNITLLRKLAILYRFVLGGFLDEADVEARMREAADLAGIGAEFDATRASALRYAEADGPQRPQLGADFDDLADTDSDGDGESSASEGRPGRGTPLAVRLRRHVEETHDVFPAGDDRRIFAQAKVGGRAELVGGAFVMRATRALGATSGSLSTAAAEAAKVLSAWATTHPPRKLALRADYRPGRIVLDLGQRDNSRCVVVTPDGWTVAEVPPKDVVFQAAGGPLPDPERGGSVEDLRELLRWPADDPRWPLVKGWLPAALLADLPRPMLGFFGPQGSAKTTTGRFVLGVLDPKPAGVLGGGFGKQRADDETKALKSYLPAWDNVSSLSAEGADLLSRLVTGDLIERRQLYTDADMVSIQYRRTGVITGVTIPRGVKPDTLDRFVLVAVEPLSGERVSEGALEAEWAVVQPRALAGVLDLAVRMLAGMQDARGANSAGLRMADYAEALWAVDPALYDAYAANVATARADMAADDPFISTLLDWLRHGEDGGEFEGTAEECRQRAGVRALGDEQWWPRNGKAFADVVTQTAELLRSVGITVTDRRSNGARLKRFILTEVGEPVPTRQWVLSFKHLPGREEVVNAATAEDAMRLYPDATSADEYDPDVL